MLIALPPKSSPVASNAVSQLLTQDSNSHIKPREDLHTKASELMPPPLTHDHPWLLQVGRTPHGGNSESSMADWDPAISNGIRCTGILVEGPRPTVSTLTLHRAGIKSQDTQWPCAEKWRIVGMKSLMSCIRDPVNRDTI